MKNYLISFILLCSSSLSIYAGEVCRSLFSDDVVSGVPVVANYTAKNTKVEIPDLISVMPIEGQVGFKYDPDKRIELDMIFGNVVLMRGTPVAVPVGNSFSAATVIGRGGKDRNLVFVEITNAKGAKFKQEIALKDLRKYELPVMKLAPSSTGLSPEQQKFSQSVSPGIKLVAHEYRGGNLRIDDVILDNRVYYKADEVAVVRSDGSYTRGRVINSIPEKHQLVVDFFSADGKSYSKNVSPEVLHYAADYIPPSVKAAPLLTPLHLSNPGKTTEVMESYKGMFEKTAGVKVEAWQRTKVTPTGNGKVGEKMSLDDLKNFDSTRVQDKNEGFIWAIDEAGNFKVLPKVMSQESLWFIRVGDDLSKHYNLLGGGNAQAAGELHFDPASGKPIFDFGSGTYSRAATPRQQHAIYEKVEAKLKEVAGAQGFDFKAD